MNTCIHWFWKVGILIIPFTDGETEDQRDGVTCSRAPRVELELKSLLFPLLFSEHTVGP